MVQRCVILLAITMFIQGDALLSYDCRHEQTNATVISLTDVAPCPDPENGYKEEVKIIQVLQRVRTIHVPVSRCYVEILRLIFRCGMFSHVSASPAMTLKVYRPIGAEECQRMHQTKTYRGYAGATIVDLKENGTTTAALTLAGSIDSNGHCEGSSYSENEITWDNVVVTASVTITMNQYWAQVELDDNVIHLQDHLKCSFKPGYCVDATAGENTWKTDVATDCDRYQVLYEGPASFFTAPSTPEQIVVVEQADKVFALSLRKKSMICYQPMWTTEHPRLLVYPVNIEHGKIFVQPSDAANVDLLAHMNTKFLYIEQSYKREIHKLHAYTVHRRCLLYREMLKNRLALAPLAPDVVGGLIQNAPGHIGRVMGEALVVMKCAPTPVKPRPTTECYLELPVMTLNNESMFMSPVTRILQTFGREVECSKVVMPLFKLDGRWVGFHPEPTVGTPPIELAPVAEPDVPFAPIQQLGMAGLYEIKDLQKLQTLMTYGAAKEAISDIIVRRAMGAPVKDQGIQFSKLFTQVDLQSIAEDTARRVWGWLAEVGLVTSGFIGIYTLLRVAKYLVCVIINGFTLHAVTGWSLYLLASLWDALTLWAMRRQPPNRKDLQPDDPRPKEEDKPSAAATEKEVVDETATKFPPPLYPQLHM